MGILQKILLILQKLDPDSKKWLRKILERVDNPVARTEFEKELKSETINYIHKIGIIQYSIFGVDIQPIAVEISKLRCFLSLIVDENVNDKENNRGVKPLPNLEFKFVCANTLIGLGGDMLLTAEAAKKINELKQVREEYLNSYGKEKTSLENKFLTIRSELSRLAFNWQKGSEKALKLAEWNPFSDKSCPWFDPEWMFGIKDGFHIVIGNPPYLESRSPKFTDDMKNAIQKAYKYRWPGYSPLPRGSDLLVYFIEVSISIVNESGHVVLITQNSWLDTEYGKKLQSFLLKNTEIKAIIDSDYKYFDSKSGPNVNTVILIFKGNHASDDSKVCLVRCHEAFERKPFSVGSVEQSFASNEVDCYVYNNGDKILHNTKWGVLLASDTCILEVLEVLQEKVVSYTEIGGANIKIGQGLNLTSEYFISPDLISDVPLPKNAWVPIMTNLDGAVFELASTSQYLIDRTKLTSEYKGILAERGIKLFNPDSTSKDKPVLILPRGVSRHFCAMNTINAFSSSYVDIYAGHCKEIENVVWNLWLFLNSSILWLIREIGGRKNLGGGLLKAEAIDLKSFPICFDFEVIDKIKNIFSTLRSREALSTIEEIHTNEHREIDQIVFDHLGLKKAQREEIIKILSEIILARSAKSKT